MYYRFVCSTEDIIECITDNTIIINTFDRYEQDDVIFCIKEKKKVLWDFLMHYLEIGTRFLR